MNNLRQLQYEAQHSIITLIGAASLFGPAHSSGWALKTLDITNSLINYIDNPSEDNMQTIINDYRDVIIYPLKLILNGAIDRMRELGIESDNTEIVSVKDPIEEKSLYIETINKILAQLEETTNLQLPPLKSLAEIKV